MVNADRRSLVLALVSSAGTVLAGCAGHEEAHAQKYSESISSVLVSEDGLHLAAIGANHHYIFDAPEVLVRALHSPIHPQLSATFSTFHVDRRSAVSGEWTLDLAADATPEAQLAAQAVGLARAADGRLEAHGKLVGRRYTGWMYRMGREQDKLNKPYVIEFATDASRGDAAADDAATPIRVAADGVQLIYWAPLAPIVIPFLFLTRAKDH